MSKNKVVDVHEADRQEETPTMEEGKEEEPEEVSEVGEEVKEEVIEEPQPNEKARAKPKASDKVNCTTGGKSMTYKNYRYRHEKLCTEEPKPVKPYAKPKAKVETMPKPKFKEVEMYEKEEELPSPTKPQMTPPLGAARSKNPIQPVKTKYRTRQIHWQI